MAEQQLSHSERGQLVALVAMPGFQILQYKVMEAAIERFKLALLNTNAAEDREVLAAHKTAKAAAQFYQEIIERINAEIEQYRHAPRQGDKPERAAEDLIESSPEQL